MKRIIMRNRFFWLFLIVMFALPVLPHPVHVPEYWVTLLNYIGLYSIVAIGLVLLTGIGGMTSFGQAAFVGIGAYATAFLTTQYGVSPWLALILFAVVFLVILKNAVNWIFGVAGILALSILLTLGFKFYKRIREKNRS